MTKNKVWVYIDHCVLPSSWEAFTPALKLAKEMQSGVTALVFGQGSEIIAHEAFHYGADDVLYAAGTDFHATQAASLLSQLIKTGTPEVILLPDTTRCRDLAAMSAVDLNTGIIVDALAFDYVAENVVVTRGIYSSKLMEKVECLTKPIFITLHPHIFPKPQADDARVGSLEKVSFALVDDGLKVLDEKPRSGRVSLTDAEVIVAGGRGMMNCVSLTPPPEVNEEKAKEAWCVQQGFQLINELAEVMGGAVAASRAVVDAGHIPYEYQVGQTGKVVSPKLYIACGISGAIQHLAGMRFSKMIVAINKDANAPIFSLARFGIVGDVYAILPALIDVLQKRIRR